LLALPFSIVTNLCVGFGDTLTKRQSLPASLDRSRECNARRHNRRMSHQLFDLHNVNAGIR